MTQTPTEGAWLVLFYGAEQERRAQELGLRKNDGQQFAVWFEREADAVAFAKRIGLGNAVRPPAGDDDYPDDPCRSHLQTVATIVLRMPDGRTFTSRQIYGYGHPHHSVHFIWEVGNYSCDCNRRAVIEEAGGPTDDDDLPCGTTIELVSLDIRNEAPETKR